MTLSKRFIDDDDISIIKKINHNNNGLYIFMKKLSYKYKMDFNDTWEKIIYKILDLYYSKQENLDEEDETEEDIKYPIDILNIIKKEEVYDENSDFFKIIFPEFEKSFIEDFKEIKYELLTNLTLLNSIFGIVSQTSINEIKSIFETVYADKTEDYVNKYKIIFCSFQHNSPFAKANCKLETNSKNIDKDINEMNNIIEKIQDTMKSKLESKEISKCFFKMYQKPQKNIL